MRHATDLVIPVKRLAAAKSRLRFGDPAQHATLLLGAAGAELSPAFGAGSARSHADSGALRIDAELPGLRCDVDTADGLAAADSLGLGRHTAAATGYARAAER